MKRDSAKTACPIEQAVLLFKSLYGDRSLVLGFSGGMDSTVLLHGLTQQGLRPTVVHVHHGLQAVADDWVIHVQQQAQFYGLVCHVERVSLAEVTRRGMEDRARTARYHALWQQVPEQGVLLTAHHQRDQAETLLLRLMRGTGVKGLGAMSSEQTQTLNRLLCRPLLAVPYDDILVYAQQHQLTWVEDPSNQQAIALRNQLRNYVLPTLRQLQPALEYKLAQTAQHCQEAHQLLTEMAQEDWQKLERSACSWSLLDWRALSWPRARQALAYALSLRNESPTAAQWQQIQQQCYQPISEQAHPQIRLAQHHLLLADDRGFCVPFEWLIRPNESCWELNNHIQTIDWLPWISLQLGVAHGSVNIRMLPRQGGERLLVNGQMRSLKSWLQKAHIPHWQMALWPVIYNEQGQLLGWPGMPSHWWQATLISCRYQVMH
jgi:tRNA(Ile)-lysidine synthase